MKLSVFVLTGAGISAESGIPVFQGTSWRGRSHYELANIEAWEKDPALVWQYYSDRRASARNAKPNAAHLALARWNQESGDRETDCGTDCPMQDRVLMMLRDVRSVEAGKRRCLRDGKEPGDERERPGSAGRDPLRLDLLRVSYALELGEQL